MDHITDKSNGNVQFVDHGRILIRHEQQRPHQRINWLPNQLRKPIRNEGDEIVSKKMVVVICQAIIPFDFIEVLSTEMDDGHSVVIKRKLANPLFVSPPMKPPLEGINRLIESDEHKGEIEIHLN